MIKQKYFHKIDLNLANRTKTIEDFNNNSGKNNESYTLFMVEYGKPIYEPTEVFIERITEFCNNKDVINTQYDNDFCKCIVSYKE